MFETVQAAVAKDMATNQLRPVGRQRVGTRRSCASVDPLQSVSRGADFTEAAHTEALTLVSSANHDAGRNWVYVAINFGGVETMSLQPYGNRLFNASYTPRP